jgi:hypothetical protein
MLYLELTPAYGRDYSSQKEVRAAWIQGKDFEVATLGPDMGRKVNKDDAPKGATLNIRYAGLRNICVIKVPQKAVTLNIR